MIAENATGVRPDPRHNPVARLRQLEDAIADLTHRIPAIQRELAAIRELIPTTSPELAPYRLWINAEQTVLARLWHDNQVMEVMTRDHPDQMWGPPVRLEPQA